MSWGVLGDKLQKREASDWFCELTSSPGIFNLCPFRCPDCPDYQWREEPIIYVMFRSTNLTDSAMVSRYVPVLKHRPVFAVEPHSLFKRVSPSLCQVTDPKSLTRRLSLHHFSFCLRPTLTVFLCSGLHWPHLALHLAKRVVFTSLVHSSFLLLGLWSLGQLAVSVERFENSPLQRHQLVDRALFPLAFTFAFFFQLFLWPHLLSFFVHLAKCSLIYPRTHSAIKDKDNHQHITHWLGHPQPDHPLLPYPRWFPCRSLFSGV